MSETKLKTPFEQGVRVALVRSPTIRNADGEFAVAMAGGRFAVPLPKGYDGMTGVFWVKGWIIVRRDPLPPLLANTTTGKTSPMNEQAMTAAMLEFEMPHLTA